MTMEQKQLFFSIIIPAHNEELYITDTLRNIFGLNYPANKFEVCVVENGSTDKTFELAKKYETENTQICSSPEKGVSKARNFGINKINFCLEWTVESIFPTL